MTPDASPAARALLTLEILQGTPGITADKLAARLGVSPRAVRRYVEVLREADIPVVAVRGPAGGYRLGRGMRLPPLVFTASEALGLVMAVLDGHHDAGDATAGVGSALGKLLRALPEAVAGQADAVRRSTAPAPDRGAARPDPETTVTLVRACSDHRRVRFRYRSETGVERLLEAEPWAVVVRHSRWYLLCHSVTSGAVRAYRVDRVREVQVRDEGFVPPSGLDPVRALEEHLAVGWEYDVEVVIGAALEAVAPYLPRTLGQLEAVDADTTRLVGTTSNPTWYAEQLARVPTAYRVAHGEEVRAALEVLGARMTAASSRGRARRPDQRQD